MRHNEESAQCTHRLNCQLRWTRRMNLLSGFRLLYVQIKEERGVVLFEFTVTDDMCSHSPIWKRVIPVLLFFHCSFVYPEENIGALNEVKLLKRSSFYRPISVICGENQIPWVDQRQLTISKVEKLLSATPFVDESPTLGYHELINIFLLTFQSNLIITSQCAPDPGCRYRRWSTSLICSSLRVYFWKDSEIRLSVRYCVTVYLAPMRAGLRS